MKSHLSGIALVAVALIVVGCSSRSDGSGEKNDGGDTSVSGEASVAEFGDLGEICSAGSPKGSPSQGVTDTEIHVGVASDIGFTKVSEFPDAAKVFTSWCNEQGGINGRKIVATTRDSNLLQVRQQMVTACREDFALVGGGHAFDGLGVKERLACGLPSFPAQVAQPQSVGSDLEVSASPSRVAGYDPFYGMGQWLIQDAYPESAGAIGIISGDSPVVKTTGDQSEEALTAAGGTIIYRDSYPPTGIADWTPYAQAIKNKGVKGLFFYGVPEQLAKLESSLTDMDYKLDWINPGNNAYNDSFIEALGTSAGEQNNVVELGGVAPLESADEVPAMQQVHDLYKRFAPDAELTLPSIKAFSAWLLFAKSAASCGNDLTRTCTYEAAVKETAWTGGGLTAPIDLTPGAAPSPCFNVEQVTPDGWMAADFQPDNGPYRCNIPAFKYQNDYGKAMTLADVGKSMADIN